MRLQVAQNGSLTGLMNPISPMPSAKRNRCDVDEASASIGTSGMKSRSMIALISAPVRTRSRSQLPSASSGMNSIKRTT